MKKCRICNHEFYGPGHKKYCDSKQCYNERRRRARIARIAAKKEGTYIFRHMGVYINENQYARNVDKRHENRDYNEDDSNFNGLTISTMLYEAEERARKTVSNQKCRSCGSRVADNSVDAVIDSDLAYCDRACWSIRMTDDILDRPKVMGACNRKKETVTD